MGTDPVKQVMLMVVSLDNPEHRAEAEDEDGGTEDDGYRTETTDTSKPAEEFLEKHPTAKIVVVIDTHCLENGYFVWTGDSKGELQACSLLTVSVTYRQITPSSHIHRS